MAAAAACTARASLLGELQCRDLLMCTYVHFNALFVLLLAGPK